jgi:hypothetical protein
MKLDRNTSYSASLPDRRIRQYLDFDRPGAGHAPLPEKSRTPPVVLLKKHLPRILENIEACWGTIELHRYLQKLLFLGSKGEGALVDEVMDALAELTAENRTVLMYRQITPFDIQYDQIEHS